MEAANTSIKILKEQIVATEEQLQRLKTQLAKLESKDSAVEVGRAGPVTQSKWPLSPDEYRRYGRQMIVPKIGIQGQLRIKSAKVLVIGVGGLGCPAAAYLGGAGTGTIGIVDGDIVETSNLHRQILHNTAKVGMRKVDSAIEYLKSLNPNLKHIAHTEHLSPQNAEIIVRDYDLVLDCTDNPASRYLISDICVLLQKPLVSASALRTEGQIIVLNSPPLPAGDSDGGPCYRCVFPKPPPAETVVSCGEGGILGPVVGVMGVLQAIEALKIITQESLAKGDRNTMLLFSAYSIPQFRSLKMRARRLGCFACSSEAELSLQTLSTGSLDYQLFCGLTTPFKVLKDEERIEAADYAKLSREKEHILVDTRDKVQFDICSIAGSINVPFSSFEGTLNDGRPGWLPENFGDDRPIYVVCRLGNDSQVVTRKMKDAGLGNNGRYIRDIRGGLKAWKDQVDSSWPEY